VHIHELAGSAPEFRRFQAHTAPINDICTEEYGEYVASAAEDGSVAVSAVLSDERQVHTHHRAVRAVRLAPEFARHRERPVVTGGASGRLHLLKKGWLFGSMTEKLIHEGEGAIYAIAWAGPLVAWANDSGVKVFDCENELPVVFVKVPAGAPKSDLCPPRLYWESNLSLLVVWGREVHVVTIRERRMAPAAAPPALASPASQPPQPPAAAVAAVAPPSSTSALSPPPAAAAAAVPAGASSSGGGVAGEEVVSVIRYQGELTCAFSSDAFLCGISPFGEDLALLWYV